MISILVTAVEAVIVAMVAAVIVLHIAAYRHAPTGTGLKPLHVIVISLSQICFIVVSASAVSQEAKTDGWSWLTTLYFAGVVLVAVALVIIGEFQRRRLMDQTREEFLRERADS